MSKMYKVYPMRGDNHKPFEIVPVDVLRFTDDTVWLSDDVTEERSSNSHEYFTTHANAVAFVRGKCNDIIEMSEMHIAKAQSVLSHLPNQYGFDADETYIVKGQMEAPVPRWYIWAEQSQQLVEDGGYDDYAEALNGLANLQPHFRYFTDEEHHIIYAQSLQKAIEYWELDMGEDYDAQWQGTLVQLPDDKIVVMSFEECPPPQDVPAGAKTITPAANGRNGLRLWLVAATAGQWANVPGAIRVHHIGV